MSTYGIQFRYSCNDIANVNHRIEFLYKDYVGAITSIQKGGSNPIKFGHRGNGKENVPNEIILGQTVAFEFNVLNTEVDTFDAIFESYYYDYKLKYYINNQLEFEGYIQPENLNKEYSKNPPYVNIKITANDALMDLKDVQYRGDAESIYRGKMTMLQHLKNALAHTGIELDIAVQLNTWHYSVPLEASSDGADLIEVLGTEAEMLWPFGRAILTEDGKLIEIENG